MNHFDVVVVGSGIVGLAHAWMAVRRGLRVLIVERTSAPQGATVRNFGMIWPIGQPAGELHAVALRSREFWLELGEANVVDVEQCGSIHLAHHEDEVSVLEEFSQLGTHSVQMLTPEEVLRRCEIAAPTGLRAGMLSSTELRVNPRIAAARLVNWLSEAGVALEFDTAVTEIGNRNVKASDGRSWRADRIIICSGSDLQTLYPKTLQASGLRTCKLQMLQTQQNVLPVAMQPHLASGLTLRHYTSFEVCPSLKRLKHRIASESPELDAYGIHVMASAFPDGRVILGDSHEYGAEITPFDSATIDELIIRELQKILRLDNWTINQRWHGIYTKHAEVPVYEAEVEDGVHVFVGTGGAGMTLSFGLADRAWQRWEGSVA